MAKMAQRTNDNSAAGDQEQSSSKNKDSIDIEVVHLQTEESLCKILGVTSTATSSSNHHIKVAHLFSSPPKVCFVVSNYKTALTLGGEAGKTGPLLL